jgi:hypothetical protein
VRGARLSREALLAHFQEQARFCGAYGSLFMAELLARMGADLEQGGPVADLLGDWPSDPRADVVSLRLAGALHAAVLTGRDPALAALYPQRDPHWRMDAIWPAARAFFARERAWTAAFLGSAPQTNEAGRAIVLLAGFLNVAAQWRGPIDALELGASAGLNLNWDRFAYRTQGWRWGADSAVVIETDWSGPAPPLDAALTVRRRAACDLNPLDIADPGERLKLKSYIWADQPARLARFDAAVDLALAARIPVMRAEASAWLAQQLAARAQDSATVVYHSVFLQYPPPQARAAIFDMMAREGARASASAPLAWLRLEPEELLEGVRGSPRMLADLTIWPSGERRVFAVTDGHARWVGAL